MLSFVIEKTKFNVNLTLEYSTFPFRTIAYNNPTCPSHCGGIQQIEAEAIANEDNRLTREYIVKTNYADITLIGIYEKDIVYRTGVVFPNNELFLSYKSKPLLTNFGIVQKFLDLSSTWMAYKGQLFKTSLA